jgi:hypothetical protein
LLRTALAQYVVPGNRPTERLYGTEALPEPSAVSKELEDGAQVPKASLHVPGSVVL